MASIADLSSKLVIPALGVETNEAKNRPEPNKVAVYGFGDITSGLKLHHFIYHCVGMIFSYPMYVFDRRLPEFLREARKDKKLYHHAR